jgi:hypothetical protein
MASPISISYDELVEFLKRRSAEEGMSETFIPILCNFRNKDLSKEFRNTTYVRLALNRLVCDTGLRFITLDQQYLFDNEKDVVPILLSTPIVIRINDFHDPDLLASLPSQYGTKTQFNVTMPTSVVVEASLAGTRYAEESTRLAVSSFS